MILRWLILCVVFLTGKIQSAHEDISEHCFINKNFDITSIIHEDCNDNLNRLANNNEILGGNKTYCEKDNFSKVDFLLLTVASNDTDGFKRFKRSAEVYDVPTKVLGMGKKWLGGDMKGPGGGYKVNLLKQALEEYANDNTKIVMFTDSYDVIITGPVYDMIEQFHKMDARIVFSAEPFCWPDETLADKYPVVESRYKYLNSGGIIGYASDLYQFISSNKIGNTGDDQLYYTKLFLDKSMRDKYRIVLDVKAAIFQNLLSASGDLEINYEKGTLTNKLYNTKPLVLHGNGPSKIDLYNFGNYLAKSWDSVKGCLTCKEDNIHLEKISEVHYPEVLVGVFVTQPTPFISEFFDKLLTLDYPKNKLRFFVYNSVKYHVPHVSEFTAKIRSKSEYGGVKEIKPDDEIKEAYARNTAINYCLSKDCDYFFNVDSLSHIDNAQTLKTLIKLNRTIVAPMMVRPYKAWSNFWGALSKDGFYERAFDYMDIVNNDRRGIWNVPYISSAYLLNSYTLKKNKPSYEYNNLDPDMSFSQNYRYQGIFMYVTNVVDFGHLVDPEAFNANRTNPDMYEIFTNRYDWEQRYIHPDYPENFNPDKVPEQPCPDVYWFPVVTPEFCKQLIEIVEAFGQWSDGSNNDNRLLGGYENVPTRDIHMNQVNYDNIWMEFMRLFVRPLQEHVFTGYFHDDERLEGGYEAVPTRDIHLFQVGLDKLWEYFLTNIVSPLQQSVFIGYNDPPRSLMNFVVRYKPDEQPSLRPHHDSSTYTINLALNTPKVDYEGGGCKFIRYNCSVTDTRLGWLIMHPGRLTHYHEGLKVVKGVRYIMISFVDP